MSADIALLKQAGAHGVVAGVLMPDGRVDVVRTRQLVELAHPLPFVFHRAFDLCPDPFSALEDIISTGAIRLLTSGQKSKAIDGLELILGLHEAARGRLEILPGGGLQKESMAEFIRKTPIRQYHFTAKKPVPNQHGLGPRIPMNGSPAISEEVYFQSDETIIRTTFQHLRQLL
jgi:copper homeostasis protein